MSDEKPNPFTIIQHRGEPNKAEFEGVTIMRQEKLYIHEWGGLVPCTPYDNHFIFEVPPSRKRMGMSEYMCTCGSYAVVANPEIERARMFVCMFHSENGYHQTTIINKKDFENVAGETLTPPKGKQWLI
jgi:hypothetical protein